MELTDRIHNYLSEGKIPISVYLDLSKAFHTLDHIILFKKLKYYGIDNSALMRFQSYLTNRYQYVDIDGVCSSMLPVKTGVPQGSVLGPLLFILYINDIPNATSKFHPILFADDTSLISSLCSFNDTNNLNYDNTLISNQINDELNLVNEWLAINKLSLNIKKTRFMIFHYRQKNISNIIPNISINNEAVEHTSNFNFLGLNIDDTLSWNKHIVSVSSKISRSLGVMSRLKRFLPTHILKHIYNSLIVPHIQYSMLCWGSKHAKIAVLQKRAVRIITKSKYNAHSDPLFKKLNVLKISDLYTCNILKFFFKHENETLPLYF